LNTSRRLSLEIGEIYLVVGFSSQFGISIEDCIVAFVNDGRKRLA